MQITSTAFAHNGEIPSKYTCQESDISPPFSWAGVPENTKSLVLIVVDPNGPDPKAPKMTWVYWLLYNITPTVDNLPEAVISDELPTGTLEGLND